jgi:hypothetical protein
VLDAYSGMSPFKKRGTKPPLAKSVKPSLPDKQKSLAMVSQRSTPWHAVSIVCGQWACERAKVARSQRYLSREAPRLPLAECSAKEFCTCRYKHHPDRRGTPRRKDEMVGLRRPPISSERRGARGRREDD